MAQDDYNIPNQSFPSFRSDLNSALSAINSCNSGTSRPSSAVAGTIWLDTSGGVTAYVLKFFDGSDDISLANINTTANTVDWIDSSVVADIVGDTSPQLGGNLDVNGNSIVSVSNGNISITPNGSGKVILDGISHPTADGTANQVLTTNGSGVLSFADASAGGTSWQSAVKTANFTAVAGEGYFINTTGGAFEVDLPTSPSVGDEIEFVDFSRNFATANLTLDQGSNKFQGSTSPKPVYNINGQSIRIVYSGSTQGWIPIVDDDVTLETPQNYSADFLVIAGGGGGGTGTNAGTIRSGAGGGAGGYRNSYASESSGGGGSSETSLSLSPGTVYTITVGAGGALGAGAGSSGTVGSNSSISGSDITDITSAGGGLGAQNGTAGGAGGSGGGAGSDLGAISGGSGTANQGFNGGNNTTAGDGSGGGGGAGQVGENAHTDGTGHGGDGGNGLASSITGSSVTRGGGGGGGASTPGSGGTGGGGNAGSDEADGSDGTANTGGGGGSAGRNLGSNPDAGIGGSGVVILRVPTASYSGTTTGSPTVTTDGSDKVIVFNASGSYTG